LHKLEIIGYLCFGMIILKQKTMNRLQGKVALITGGNSGIGYASAQQFLAEGASQVIITGRNTEAVEQAVRELGPNVTGFVSDTGNMAHISQLAEQIRTVTDHVDVLFINAGTGKFLPIEFMTEEAFDLNMDVNFKGAYFTIQALLPLMTEGGSIVLNTSINAHIGMPTASVYSASKAALISLARNLSAELLPRRIRVNAISPGPVVTPFHSTKKLGITEEQLGQMGAGILSQIPVGRFGTMDEIAKAVVFFASDESSFVLGAELIADGGMSTL
jgi:NAD(P)-dependent dehydrogenase (short-subunit alcohol dehydrogenase family)